ncbi:MAG: oligoendopeptidase F [Clostridiaceae bacterium]|nr:oligoendopeptidase F [Clostridiaceae bacterium]
MQIEKYEEQTETRQAVKQVKRSQVPVEQTWDMTTVFPSLEAWEASFVDVSSKKDAITKYQGKLAESADTLLVAIKSREAIMDELTRLAIYAFHRSDEDTADPVFLAMKGRLGALLAAMMGDDAWFEPEIANIPEDTLNRFIEENSDLQTYHHFFDNILREKKYQLSPKEEALLARASQIFDGADETYGILSNADMTFDPIENEKGEMVEMSHSHFGLYLENRDPRVRRDAFTSMYKTFGQFRNTCATTLTNAIRVNTYNKTIRGFESGREASLFRNVIPESVYDSLLEAVNERLPLLHRYVRLRKRMLGVDELHSYDMYVPLVEDFDPHYTFDEAKEILYKGLAPLGEEYVSLLKRAFDERWVDWAVNAGKRSGAYSGGAYSTNPFLLISWQGTLDNLFTLAHELGHSLHSYLTRKAQPFQYGDYPIFLAEIASTCNEILLTDYLLKTATDDKMRAAVINNYLDGFKGTVFRQTQFAEFEHVIHQADEAGIALTADYLSEQYGELNKKYYGDALTFDPDIANEWARIPHFYYNFYVFQYATGFSAATSFAQAILKEGQPAVDRFLGFLASGRSDWPIDVLKKAGVDMTKPETIIGALDEFERSLDEMEALVG